jgi:hypothetical protein
MISTSLPTAGLDRRNMSSRQEGVDSTVVWRKQVSPLQQLP